VISPGGFAAGATAIPTYRRDVPAGHHAESSERDIVMLQRLQRSVVDFLKAEDGPTAVEYAVMLALIIVVCITAITTLGSNSNNTFSFVATQVGKTGS
jgi:pilus assembly protein Flp/PilA